MNCNACHQEIRPGSKFCPLCGAAQVEITPCPVCGAELPPGKPYCPACGSDLQPEAAEAAAEPGGFYQDYETTQAYPPADDTDAPSADPAGHPGDTWRAQDISDIPDEPMSEMMLESDWNPESALSSFARRIEAEDMAAPETELPASADDLQAQPPPAAADASSSAKKPALFDLLLEAEAMRAAENGDPNATVIMRSPMARQPDRAPSESVESAAPLPPAADPEPATQNDALHEEPVTEWSVETVRLRAEELEMPDQSPLEASAPRSRRLVPLVIAVVALVAAVGGGLAWWLSDDDGSAEEQRVVAPPAPVPSVPVDPITPRPLAPAPAEPPIAPPSPSEGEPMARVPDPAPTETLPPVAPEPRDPVEPQQEPVAPPPAVSEPAAPDVAEPPPAPKPKPTPKPKPAPKPKPKPAPEPEPEPPPAPEPPPPAPTVPAVPAWLSTMRAELAVCDEKSFFAKAICREKVRWNHCAPDRWDTVPECAVKNQ